MLHNGKYKSMNTLLSYEEARRIVREIGCKTAAEYRKVCQIHGLPSAPNRVYKSKGWVDWCVFLGKRDDVYPNYKEAIEIVRKNGIKSMKQYKKRYKEYGLPSHPELFYKDKGWSSYLSFWGKERRGTLSYDEAKQLIKKEGIKNRDEYRSFPKDQYDLPSHPDLYYKDKGWLGWSDFLGKTTITTPKERKYRILSKLAISPILLHEDAPLQVIYMLATQLDKQLAKEMEELLCATSFEERLNWVKEQLKKLKEESALIHLPSYVSPSDELAAMESIFEEYDVTDQISIIMENYLHNAVNRGLISEYDG